MIVSCRVVVIRRRELLDLEAVAGHLLPSGWVVRVPGGVVFPDAMFADLFPSGRGRPSLPAPVVASVLVFPDDADNQGAAGCRGQGLAVARRMRRPGRA
jgi:hypothetical protein